jgi:hypothetical protein
MWGHHEDVQRSQPQHWWQHCIAARTAASALAAQRRFSGSTLSQHSWEAATAAAVPGHVCSSNRDIPMFLRPRNLEMVPQQLLNLRASLAADWIARGDSLTLMPYAQCIGPQLYMQLQLDALCRSRSACAW